MLLFVFALYCSNSYTQNGESKVLGASEIYSVKKGGVEKKQGKVRRDVVMLVVMVIFQQISITQIRTITN